MVELDSPNNKLASPPKKMKRGKSLLSVCQKVDHALSMVQDDLQATFVGQIDIKGTTSARGNDLGWNFVLLLAATTSKDIGGIVMRLLEGSNDAVSYVASPEQLAMPAQVYGSPKGSESLSAGLYIDNPNTDDHPRWGLGFAIQAVSDQEAKALLTKVQAADPLDEPMRLVKIQDGIKILRGRIPWRSIATPVVAPYLHWERYYDIYKKGGYTSNNGRPDNHEGSVALEIYVTGPSDSFMYIDYIILMGNTSAFFIRTIYYFYYFRNCLRRSPSGTKQGGSGDQPSAC
ncbi:unnamed protein product [Cylindrotheca closterium]|uniref:Uncharacterized protein n=1 Tax=Cylindrotheca closterium TaxID=2856 RepID=A0AAD2FT44_9STRA|nr:unnamed protein product [Cylindrotheca closterium]